MPGASGPGGTKPVWVGWAWGQAFMRPPPPDVDECAWEADLCQEDQRCVNLLGSYHCLPDCRPGFRVAADGASCEGDKAGGLNCPAPGSPVVARAQQRACRVSLGRWGFREAGAQGGWGGSLSWAQEVRVPLASTLLLSGPQVCLPDKERAGQGWQTQATSATISPHGSWSSLCILNTASPASVTTAAALRDET